MKILKKYVIIFLIKVLRASAREVDHVYKRIV